MDYALIDVTGAVLTRVTVDDAQEQYDPGEGLTAVPLAGDMAASAGFTWSSEGGFVAPPPPPVDLEALRLAKAMAVDARRDATVAGGYQHNFGSTAGIRTLDNRNEADAINWLGLKGIVDSLIAADAASQPVSVVAADNTVFEASAGVVASALVDMAVWRSRLVLQARALKNALAAAADATAIEAIDIDDGWD